MQYSINTIIEDINWGLLILAICSFLCFVAYLVNKNSILEKNTRQAFMTDCVKSGHPPAECATAWRASRLGY